MKTVNYLVAFLAALTLFACANTQSNNNQDPANIQTKFKSRSPQWVKDGKALGFPESRYICGLGYSPRDMQEVDAMDQAKLEAFTEISTQIQTQISSEFTSIRKQVVHNDNFQDSADLTNVAKQVTKEVFSGIQVAKRYYDPDLGMGCVYAVMDRQKFGNRLLKEASDANAAVTGHFKTYDQSSNDPSMALKSLVHSECAMENIVKSHLKLIGVGSTKAMAAQMEKYNNAELSSKISGMISASKDSVRIESVSGNEQKANLTGALKEPVVVKVFRVIGGRPSPVANFPINVLIEDPTKATATPNSMTTDNKGLFSFTLSELKPTGAGANTVKVQLNFKAIEKKSTLSPPSFDVTYIFPTMENTKIGVMIYETIDSKENRSPYTESYIKDRLGDIGFETSRLESDIPSKDAINLPLSKLIQKFGDQCDYLVFGTAEAEYSSNDFGFEHYRTRMVIDAIELNTGKTIHFEVPSAKGSKLTKPKAAKQSLYAAGMAMAGGKEKPGHLDKKFIARFKEGAEWSN